MNEPILTTSKKRPERKSFHSRFLLILYLARPCFALFTNTTTTFTKLETVDFLKENKVLCFVFSKEVEKLGCRSKKDTEKNIEGRKKGVGRSLETLENS